MFIANERIAEWRKLLGISVEDFSKESNIPVEYITRIEKGTECVDSMTLIKISDVYGLSADYLLGLVEGPIPIIKDERSLEKWHSLTKLPESSRSTLTNMIRIADCAVHKYSL